MDSVVSGTNSLLTSGFGSSSRGERHNSYYANHPQPAVHLVMFTISIHLRRSRPEKPNHHCDDRKLNSMPQWQELNSLPQWQELSFSNQWSNLNWLFFQNTQILRTISSGYDVIHTPASFHVWGLLWRWWLSYPLRMSVKLYPMTMP